MNYYNEHDPKAAAWLRELIKAGLIADGIVDERDIQKVRPEELSEYTQCHFFAGIGGWSYALRLAGWPDDEPVWTGSCPCQPFSVAGAGKGTADERHLWPDFKRLIEACKPPIVFGEQVASKAGREWLAGVFADLEGMGYQRAAADLCAAGVGAPHIRQRLYWVADSDLSKRDEWTRSGKQSLCVENKTAGGMADANGKQKLTANSRGLHTEPGSGGSDGWLANPASERRNGSAGMCRTNGRAITETSGGMGHADDARPQGQRRLIELNDSERRQAAERHNPASGFWGGFNLLNCTDGKTRRIESATLKMVDGIPSIMGIDRAQGYGKLEEEIIQYAKTKNERPGEALSILWHALIEETIQRHFGGQIGFSSPPVLLSFLRELTNERWQFSESILRSSQETKEAIMRSLWWEKASPRSPHKRGLEEQHTGKPPNTLCVLSSILARHIQTHWGEAVQAYADAGFPLAHGIKGRVGLLRGYGNAIISQLAAQFIQATIEALNP